MTHVSCTFCGFDNPSSITYFYGKPYCQFCAASKVIVTAAKGKHDPNSAYFAAIVHQSRTCNLLLQELASRQVARGYDPLGESTDYFDREPTPLDFIVQAWASKGETGLPEFIRRQIEDEHAGEILALARRVRELLRRDVPWLRLFTWEEFRLQSR